jgi:hypothetical protein
MVFGCCRKTQREKINGSVVEYNVKGEMFECIICLEAIPIELTKTCRRLQFAKCGFRACKMCFEQVKNSTCPYRCDIEE